jgi:hypothetical protein
MKRTHHQICGYRANTAFMKTNPLKVGVISEDSAGVGTVTRRMVCARAAAYKAHINPISNI